MPVKKRLNKQLSLTDWHYKHLLQGPDTTYIAGAGYLAQEEFILSTFSDATAEQAAIILAEMKNDWHRVGGKLLAEGHEQIWALEAFGMPE
jgi:hypothetical protein